MATVITEECINCDACEPECPNTAIYQGGVEYDWQGGKHTAISEDLFYIVPEKCTECVGFYDEEACAAVCPVDCCIPDPEIPEEEPALIARAREIHPDKEFEEEFPSRFRQKPADADGADAGQSEAAPATAVAAAVAPASGAVVASSSIADVEVPLGCRACQGDYSVAFRFLSPGTVLRCPHCQFSYSPSQHLYLAVRARLERYADELNAEIDRHNDLIETEQRRFGRNRKVVEGLVNRELKEIVDGLTEEPKKSMFG